MDDDAVRTETPCEDADPPLPMSRACSARATAERAMLRAMLLDAVQCLEGLGCPKRCRERLAIEARAWVVRRDAAPFSFENVCAYLGLPTGRLRRILLRLTAAGGGSHADAAASRRRASDAEVRARAERNDSIRLLREAGLRPAELAERFGLSYESILAICTPRGRARRVAA
jgi:hypothetical protein